MLNVNIDDLLFIYKRIRSNTKHKEKLFKFEMNLSSNLIYIKNILEKGVYSHGKYNIFLISDPKYRIVMSENIYDKIVNNYIGYFYLNPAVEKVLINTDVASRRNKGNSYAIKMFKKYVNNLKCHNDEVFVLKIDIEKYFYNIDHKILKNKINKLNISENIKQIVFNIIDSTNKEYVNKKIINIINKYKVEVPLYKKNKGLCLGSNISQFLALLYLNDINHLIKEKLKIKCFIKYMDDFILLSNDKCYLNYCKSFVSNELNKLELKINNKTNIYKLSSGVTFIGYIFTLNNKRLIIRISGKNKRRINKKLKYLKKYDKIKYDSSINSYKGYTKITNYKIK